MTATADTAVFRLPHFAYLTVLFLLLCVTPLALSADGGDEGAAVGWTWRLALFVIPLLAALFIARTATVVSADGLVVRAALGSRRLPWEQVRGLSVTGRAVYAVVDDGAVRLPCVRTADLAALSRASGGRLPQLPEAVRKYAAGRRRR